MKENILEKPVIKIGFLKSALVIVVFTALAIIAPMIAHHFHLAGQIFLPMHFFVLTAGLVFGKKTGFFVGAISPIVSYSLSGMPLLNLVPLMTVEIAAYGFFAGYFREKGLDSFKSIILAMILGRLILFLGAWLILSANPAVYLFQALKLGVVGIALQLALIPFITNRINNYLK